MKLFNARALHGANGQGMSAAQDLVRRTLAQHGLSADLPGASPFPGTAAAPATGARLTHACPAGQREYLLHVPDTARNGAAGAVMMLHGCTQTPEDFARGTGMNALADAHNLVVIWPAQARGDNAQSCWNWFSRGDQRRDRGEPAILASLAAQVARDHGVPASRTFVAGLSAGGAMAVILGETHGDVFAAVGAHSGLPYGCARDVGSAFAAMAGNGEAAALARGAARSIVFHGTADATVSPENGTRIARDALAGLVTVETEQAGQVGGRRFTVTRNETAAGQARCEHWAVEGLGHAWSGGQAGGSYADPAGPDASAEMVRFFLEPAPG